MMVRRGRRLRWLVGAAAAALLGAGAAEALDRPAADPEVVELLSGISYVPSKSSIDVVLGEAAVEDLVELARSSAELDPGLRLAALRALGQYGADAIADEALRDALAEYAPAAEGVELLYLRAAMGALAEASGPAAAGELAPLLEHPVRDVRATAAAALGRAGGAEAIPALRARLAVETVLQVRLALEDALRGLQTPAQLGAELATGSSTMR